ncbi:GH3 auxin-responsive promoter family protein [Fimbriiglobus ruber]|uniref:Putative auxin-regulated protein n=1 Tax=Fimbriiglobus ruber TaxID=1908690 RepID=A0A225D445_9BACT|nr:GH3 auxin-responsive promoter family protein [Fimbriiglobus ruber]OWK34414.1 putative auxin-regulated protein [Fimbriiglobus ruber]
MTSTAWLAPVAGSALVRRVADAGFLPFARSRVRHLDRMNVAAVQTATLQRLVRMARDTQFGREHDFASVRTIADYQARVPVREYEEFWQKYWKDAYPRLAGVTWPSAIPYYALSSGTTSGATKYIPVSSEMVASNRKAALTTLSLFRNVYSEARTLTGKFFFLGGSTDLRQQPDGSLAGDLSGIAAKEVSGLMRPYTYPSLEVGLISNWETKLARLAEESVREPITAISGVPSWVLKMFDAVKQQTGKKTIADIWPMLRLIVHGGTKFDPYRDVFKSEIGNDAVKYCEVYPCSEGFVATEDPRHPGLLRMVPDHDIFFEFIPRNELGSLRPTRHTLANVELGLEYAVVVTSCAGLWGYLIGDTVRFESRTPPLIRFTGRTKYFLSAFGEHLIQEEIDGAVAKAAHDCGVTAVDHHVGPIFRTAPGMPGRHLYLVEFRGPPPADLDAFARVLDGELIRMNEDYAAHRAGDLTMLKPEIRVVPPEGFSEWMKAHGRRVGGQIKVPRMDNSGALTTELATWFAGRGSGV